MKKMGKRRLIAGILVLVMLTVPGLGVNATSDTREKLENMDAGELDGLKQAILRTGKTVEQEMLLAAACSR